MIERATIDFETRSAVSIKTAGTWRYSEDPSTEVMCLAFRLPHYEEEYVDLWHPAYPHLGIAEAETRPLAALFEWVSQGGMVEAHNAQFERAIWRNVCGPRLGWPRIPSRQWICSAAKAASHALPRGLDEALSALRLDVRKLETSVIAAGPRGTKRVKIVQKLAKPRKPRKAERERWARTHSTPVPMPTLWWESLDLFETLWAYCKQDVLAEHLLSEALPDLSDYEQEVYLADQEANERGFLLDRGGVESALSLIAEENRLLLEEFQTLTQGQVESPRQRARLMTWLGEQGLVLPNTQKTTVDDALQGNVYVDQSVSQSVFRVLEILRQLGASSTAKYDAMRTQLCGDNRIRGGMLYHGATTGRWSGAGVQPHNFPKGTVDRVHEPTGKHPDWFGMEKSWEIVKTIASREDLSDVFGASVMQTLSAMLRGSIVAPAGRDLFVADYAGIEARVLLWLAEDLDALGVFYRGEDIYCVMAEAIYGYPCNKTDHPTERGIGKIAVLGLGYQMGWSKFIDTAALGGVVLTEDFSRQVVDAYRAKFAKVRSMWYDQERCAIQATVDDGVDYGCGKMVWERVVDTRKGTDFLYCHLPSGRRLAYPNPQVKLMPTSWGDMKEALTFMGIDTYTRQWRRQQTYGGSIVENQTQAVARDFMAHAFLTLAKSPVYDVTLSVHDELVAEAHPLQGNLKEFETILTTLPEWGEGCPIAAEGFQAKRYRK